MNMTLRAACAAAICFAAAVETADAVTLAFPTVEATQRAQGTEGSVGFPNTGPLGDENDFLRQQYTNTGTTSVDELAFVLTIAQISLPNDASVDFNVLLNGTQIGEFMVVAPSTGNVANALIGTQVGMAFNDFGTVAGDGLNNESFLFEIVVPTAQDMVQGSVAFALVASTEFTLALNDSVDDLVIPLPAGFLLLATGLGGLLVLRRNTTTA
ncbi:MAG: VPLPA-CTERM sorting domain-containing protein [Pseudomonadota bacterium]